MQIHSQVTRALGLLSPLALGVALSVVLPCDAAQVYGATEREGAIRVRALDTNQPGRVRDVGMLPGSARGPLRSLASGGDGALGLVHDSSGADGGRSGLVVSLGDPASGLYTVGEAEFALPDREAMVDHAASPTADIRVVTYSRRTDRPPFGAAVFSRKAGGWRFAYSIAVPESVRLSNLTQCPDGRVYATWQEPEHAPELAAVDWVKGTIASVAPLRLAGGPLWRDVVSLACGPGSELYGLADPLRSGKNALYRVDPGSGHLILVGPFDVDTIGFASAGPAARGASR